MPARDVIEIDEEKCNGCGQCIPKCVEGALQIVDGKARLISDQLCDGLGACIGHCPQGALSIVKKKATAFNAPAVDDHRTKMPKVANPPCECSHVVVRLQPASAVKSHGRTQPSNAPWQWPLALRLVPVSAPFFKDAHLLVAADCAPFAYAKFHEDFLRGKVLVFGCPKFDDARGYIDKLAEILQTNSIRRVTLVHMEVRCCSGLRTILESALVKSGKKIPLDYVVLTTSGGKCVQNHLADPAFQCSSV